MNRSDDYGRRRWPDQQYGGYEEGYGHVPGDDRDWRRRDLSAGRYGNRVERQPYNAYERDEMSGAGRPGGGRDLRGQDAWREGRTAQLSGGWRSRGATVYYPGRSTYDEPRDESSPHSRGYVSAYSSGYEDGYQAGNRTAQDSTVGRERWQGTRSGYRSGYETGAASGYGSGYEDYGVEAGRNFRQRPHGNASTPDTYGRRPGPKNYTRSDERIREEVCERLAHAHTLDVSDVTVAVTGGVVTLTGTVNHRRAKYEIEDIADDTYGVPT